MSEARSRLMILFVVAAAVWHGLALADAWRDALHVPGGNDFASYYYALQVARDGGDPYDRRQLGDASRDDEIRRGVHPFFYPPPFLLTMVWALPLELTTAYRVWFWLDELLALACLYALWRWWRPLGPTVGPTLAAALGALTCVPNNHIMGQANLPVLLLVILGLQAEEQGRARLAGGLMGAACMMKMSPALFVAWWMLRGRWEAAITACASAVVYTVLSLGLVGPGWQVGFYTEVLPTFGSGSYNGLTVGIDLFGNHAIPNIYDAWFPPAGNHFELTSPARILTFATLIGLVAWTGRLFRAAPTDPLARAAQIGAICALMLLVPVITYEHHLVWLLPSAVVATEACVRGRLGRPWTVAVGLALAVWCYDLVPLKAVSLALQHNYGLLGWLARESKMFAIFVLYEVCLRVGAAPARASS